MKEGETFVNVGNNKFRNDSPYSRRSGGMNTNGMGTYVPGMHDNAPSVEQSMAQAPKNNAPVVGFLYSISRKGIGEYWPLHLGTNTIGRAADNDICLREMSVSEHHATLSIKQMKTTKKLIASIRDTGSKNGMYLNDEELDYDNHSCKTNDIVCVGFNYKLLLILIDAEQYGLSISEDFVAMEENEDFEPTPMGFDTIDNATHNRNNPYSGENRNVDTGTVDLNGAQIGKPGGTKFM
mgnify:CR=1 FL=1